MGATKHYIDEPSTQWRTEAYYSSINKKLERRISVRNIAVEIGIHYAARYQIIELFVFFSFLR
jgi:hypothetical protein